MSEKISNDEFLLKRKARQKRIRKRRLKIFFVIMLILALLVGIILSLTVFFPTKKVVISGSKIYTVDEIIKASEIKAGDNVIILSEKKIEEKIKHKLPFVEEIELSKKLPDKIEIKVVDAKEYIAYNKGSEYFSVSKSGWVMKKYSKPPENISVVKGVSFKAETGSEIKLKNNKANTVCQEVLKNLKDAKLKINLIDVSDTVSIKLKVEDIYDVKLGNANYIDEKVKHLAKVISERTDGKGGTINLSAWTKEKPQSVFEAKTE